jgi:hypothetical protein
MKTQRTGVKAASKKTPAAKKSRAAMNAGMTKATQRNKSKRQIALDAKRGPVGGKGGGAGGKQGGNGGKAAAGVHSIKKKQQATKKPNTEKQAGKRKAKKKAKKKAKTAKGKGTGGTGGATRVEGRRLGSMGDWAQYESMSEAALDCKIGRSGVSECVRGTMESTSGWVFRFVDPTLRPSKRLIAERLAENKRKRDDPEKKKEAKRKRDNRSEDEKEAGRLKTRQRDDKKKARALLLLRCKPHTVPAHTMFMGEASKVVEVIAKKPKLLELLVSSRKVVIMDTSVKRQMWSKDKLKPAWYMSKGARAGGQGANLCRAAFFKCDVNRIGGVDDGTGTCNNNNEIFATLSIPLQLAAPPLSIRPPLPDPLPNHHFTFPPSTPFLDFTFNR